MFTKDFKLLVDITNMDIIITDNYIKVENMEEYGKQYIQKHLNICKENFYKMKDLGNKRYWLKQAKNYQKMKLKVMSFTEYLKVERDYYLNRPIKQVTEKDFYDMLGVLPPLKWETINGVEEFCNREMLSGNYTNQYCKYNGKYFTKIVDVTDNTTFLHNFKNKLTGE